MCLSWITAALWLVSFTFSETVDTILPVAPETMYEIEGENISLWALTFVSLTKDENLGFLEYRKALQRLQPYIVETRGDYILVRGLSLAEMECQFIYDTVGTALFSLI